MAPDDKAWGGCGPLTARDAPASCCCSGGGLDSAETKRRTDKPCAESGMGRFRGEGLTDLVLCSGGDVFVAHLPSLPEQELLHLEARFLVRLMTQHMTEVDPLSLLATPDSDSETYLPDGVVPNRCP